MIFSRFKLALTCLIALSINGLTIIVSKGQTGCTDPYATNYNAKAKKNDGSCTYKYAQVYPAKRGEFSSTILESSGLVLTNGRVWTHNDSGNPAEIYSVDTSTGKTLQTVYIDNYPNTDWEDITADANYIYIENAGNNDGIRTDLKILKIKKSDINNDASIHVKAEAINFSYADQTSFVQSSTHNFDCESLISIDTTLYIFTKDRGDLKTRVYKLSKTPGTYKVSPYLSFAANGLVTGADYDPVKKELALVGYLKGHINSFIWIFNDFTSDSFFNGNKRRVDIGVGLEWQTEGICYDGSGRLFISCESAGDNNAALYEINESAWMKLPSGINNSNATTSHLQYYPNPASDMIHFENDLPISSIDVVNQLGQTIFTDKTENPGYNLNLSKFKYKSGLHYIKITSEGNTTVVKAEFR